MTLLTVLANASSVAVALHHIFRQVSARFMMVINYAIIFYDKMIALRIRQFCQIAHEPEPVSVIRRARVYAKHTLIYQIFIN